MHFLFYLCHGIVHANMVTKYIAKCLASMIIVTNHDPISFIIIPSKLFWIPKTIPMTSLECRLNVLNVSHAAENLFHNLAQCDMPYVVQIYVWMTVTQHKISKIPFGPKFPVIQARSVRNPNTFNFKPVSNSFCCGNPPLLVLTFPFLFIHSADGSERCVVTE